MKDLSIIILNYNTGQTTLNCLESIIASNLENLKIEIIVVDNHSTDNSIELLKKFKQNNSQFDISIIRNQENLGFSAGNNTGLKRANAKNILLLNSDVILEKDTLIKQIIFNKQYPQFSASTCKLLLKKGDIDPACHRGFPTPWASLTYFLKLEKIFPKTKIFGQYHQGWKDMNSAHAVDAISGAFFFVKKEILEKVGLLDEGFFMYGEDLDWCLRIKEAGFMIGYYPENKAIHLKGVSGRKQKNTTGSKTSYYFWDSMEIFYRKHYQKKYFKLLNWIIIKLINRQKSKYAK